MTEDVEDDHETAVGGGPAYCFRCGARLTDRRIEGRRRRYCRTCDRPVYRNPKPCAGVLVVKRDELLVIRRTQPPAVGAWSIPAGYLEHDEAPAEAAVRELREETGVRADPGSIDLHATRFVGHADRHVLVLVYVVAREETACDPVAGSDAADARFRSIDELEAATERVEPGYLELFRTAVGGIE